MKAEYKTVRHGTHYLLGEGEGYAYNSWKSECYTLASHMHECFEFVYVKEGTCIYTIEGKEFVVSSGDIIFTCPNEIHLFSFPQKCMFERHFLHVYPNYVKNFQTVADELLLRSHEHKNLIPAYLVEQYNLDKYFTDLRYYHDISALETYMIAHSCITGLMAKICNILRTTEINCDSSFQNNYINKILRYIHIHSAESISLSNIADDVHITPVYVSKLFKKETGMTLKSYINMYRIVKAKNFMLAGYRIIDLPDKCGFKDYSTFYRAFLKYSGISPEEFKRQNGF